jgi:phosphate uptake regulator
MFEDILEVWKRESLLNQSKGEVEQMLDLTKKMFIDACRGLSENKAFSDVDLMDEKVNKKLVDVRRKVLEHLTVSPQKSLSESLVLMLAAIDLERVGDYCKNIAEINDNYKKGLRTAKHFQELEGFKEKITENFDFTKEGFLNCDLEKAKRVVDDHKVIKERLDEIANAMLAEKTADSREAAAIALYARFMKRVHSHLQHIASTVTNPFERIGFDATTKKLVDD